MLRIRALLIGLVLMMMSGLPDGALAAGDRRVALIIGNSDYQHSSRLANPVDDARLMSKALGQAGFEVIDGFDLDYAGMQASINRFAETSYDADVALIYYAGHGMQVNGRNYLVPVDAELTSPAHLKTRTIQVDDFMAALPPDPAVGIIILDACRDNPMARTLGTLFPNTRSTGAGLATVDVKSADVGTGGIIIAYATDPGAVAYDGKGANSPYTTSLARHLVEPNVEIQSALTRVRSEVTAETGGKQRPWHNASLGREVYLGGQVKQPEVATITLGKGAAAEQASQEAETPIWEIEQRMWDEASKRNTVAHYNAYLARFPKGIFAELAKLNIEQLEAAPAVAMAAPASQPRSTVPEEEPAPAAADPEKEPGTALTEAALELDRQARIDLQERLIAIGYDLDEADGDLGAQTRKAIGAWQEESGLPDTTFLTRRQLVRLKLETNEALDRYRTQRAEEVADEKKRQEDEAAAAEKRQQEEAAAEKAKQQEEAAEPKQDQAAAQRKKQQEQAAAKRQREQAAAERKRQERAAAKAASAKAAKQKQERAAARAQEREAAKKQDRKAADNQAPAKSGKKAGTRKVCWGQDAWQTFTQTIPADQPCRVGMKAIKIY